MLIAALTKPGYTLWACPTLRSSTWNRICRDLVRSHGVFGEGYALLGLVSLLFFYSVPQPPHGELVYLLPALYLGLVIHELGHAVTARLAGLDVGGLCIGGFMVMQSGGRLDVHLVCGGC